MVSRRNLRFVLISFVVAAAGLAALWYAAAIIAAILSAPPPTVIEVVDSTRPQTFILAPKEPSDFHSSLTLHVHGTTDGEVAFVPTYFPTPMRFKGAFDSRVIHDYFAKTCTIEYRPVGVSQGKVTIEYQFR